MAAWRHWKSKGPFIVLPPCLRAQQIRLSRKGIPICKVMTLYKFCDFLIDQILDSISLIICLLIYRLGLKVRESLSFFPPAEERILRRTAAHAYFLVKRKVTKSASQFNQPATLCRGPKIGFPNTASHHNFFFCLTDSAQLVSDLSSRFQFPRLSLTSTERYSSRASLSPLPCQIQIVWQCTRSLLFNCCLFLTLLLLCRTEATNALACSRIITISS